MSRKRNDEDPIFRGYDAEGEPIFVWYPGVPEVLRAAYAEVWKETHPRPPSPAKEPRHE